MDGDVLVCDERGDTVLIRLAHVIATEGVGRFLEVGTWYVADCEGDVPLRAHLPNLSGTGLEEIILAPSGLKDVDSGLVVVVQVDELVCELRSHSSRASAALRASRWQMRGLSRSTLDGKVV